MLITNKEFIIIQQQAGLGLCNWVMQKEPGVQLAVEIVDGSWGNFGV